MASLKEQKRAKKALNWFIGKVKDALGKQTKGKKEKSTSVKDMKDSVTKLRVFHMYVGVYPNPLWKDELPVYDAMPMFFPTGFVGPNHGNGAKIQGINIHYLPPAARKLFVMELHKILTKFAEQKGYDVDTLEELNDIPQQEITKIVGRYMNFVYTQNKGAGKMLRQCFRSYFPERFAGRLVKIKVSEWENACDVVLPAWKKMNAGAVYSWVKKGYDKYKSNSRAAIY